MATAAYGLMRVDKTDHYCLHSAFNDSIPPSIRNRKLKILYASFHTPEIKKKIEDSNDNQMSFNNQIKQHSKGCQYFIFMQTLQEMLSSEDQ